MGENRGETPKWRQEIATVGTGNDRIIQSFDDPLDLDAMRADFVKVRDAWVKRGLAAEALVRELAAGLDEALGYLSDCGIALDHLERLLRVAGRDEETR